MSGDKDPVDHVLRGVVEVIGEGLKMVTETISPPPKSHERVMEELKEREVKALERMAQKD